MQILQTLGKSVNYGISLILFLIAIGLAIVALPFWGNRSLIVKSGSMTPTIQVGDLIVVSPNSLINSPVPAITAKYKVGDIVAFREPSSPNVIVTHRVANAEIKDGQVWYQTKGDANNVTDQTLISEKNIIGRSQFTIPKVGQVFAFTKSKVGYPLLIILPALLVILLEINNIFKEVSKKKFLMRGSVKEKLNLNGFHIFIPIIAFALIFQTSHSFFVDSSQSTANIFAAAEVFPTKSGDIVINELNWAGSTKGTADEWVELRNTTGHTIDISNWQITKWIGSGTPHEALMLTIPASSSIPAGGLFLIADKSPGVGTALTASPDIIDSSVVLDNTTLQVKLYVNNWDTGGLLIDTAGNKNAPLAGIHDGTGTPKKFFSMERNSTPSSGTVAGNWHTATTSVNLDSENDQNKGTPKAVND